MLHITPASFGSSVVIFIVGVAIGSVFAADRVAHAQSAARVFELRTYTAPDGKLAELHARFRNHTLRIFEKHGMTNVVYLAPQDAPLKDNTVVYLLAHKSREAAKASWDAFLNDPEWKKVAADSQVNGRIVTKAESVFLDPTDYSPMK